MSETCSQVEKRIDILEKSLSNKLSHLERRFDEQEAELKMIIDHYKKMHGNSFDRYERLETTLRKGVVEIESRLNEQGDIIKNIENRFT